MRSIRRLRRDGFLRNSLSGKPSSYSLSSKGVELIEQFEEAWEIIRHENPRIFPLKSYERLSVPPVIAEEPPRLAN
jgi:DNA-binding PadR family transcriptional regulator